MHVTHSCNQADPILPKIFNVWLQVMHKAPILESKQIEHVLNERRILEEASSHPFCVGLVRAYQDKPCLYLLQEWVGGQHSPIQ